MEIRVTTHSGEDDTITVKDYDAKKLAEQLNDNDVHSIQIGDNIYSRIDIKNVKPIA